MPYPQDGIYLQELPRRIEGIFLGAASRAEVRLLASAGLSAAASPVPAPGPARQTARPGSACTGVRASARPNGCSGPGRGPCRTRASSPAAHRSIWEPSLGCPPAAPPQVLIRCAGAPGARYVVTSRTCHPFSINCFGYQPDIPVNRVNHIGPFFQASARGQEVALGWCRHKAGGLSVGKGMCQRVHSHAQARAALARAGWRELRIGSGDPPLGTYTSPIALPTGHRVGD